MYVQACDIVGNKQVIGKCEIISVRAMEIYAGVEIQIYTLLTSALDAGEG